MIMFSFVCGLICGSIPEGSLAMKATAPSTNNMEVVTLGGGCFWCLEAICQQIKGVEKVVSGYSGGTVANPTYKQVCSGQSGHAEVVQITFDSTIIPLKQLLAIFFAIHDPTTLNRQGNDVGTQYRSAVFYRTPEQKAVAEEAIKEVNTAKLWAGAIVTELVPFKVFYAAEGYHQNYYRLNPNQPYCNAVITPKIAKFQKQFRDQRQSN
jgi:methionine-S-sulfoxide reductase